MSWDDGKHTKVKRVQLTFDDVIRSIEVEYDGTSLKSQPRGTVGTKSDGFTLSPDEYITEVNGYYKTVFSGDVITALTFKTNKKTYGTYGNKTRNYFSLNAPSNNQIAGFLGSSSNALNSIDAHFGPLPPPDSTGTNPSTGGTGGSNASNAGTNPGTGGSGTNPGGNSSGGNNASNAGTNPGIGGSGTNPGSNNSGGSNAGNPGTGGSGTNPGGNNSGGSNAGNPGTGGSGTNPGGNNSGGSNAGNPGTGGSGTNPGGNNSGGSNAGNPGTGGSGTNPGGNNSGGSNAGNPGTGGSGTNPGDNNSGGSNAGNPGTGGSGTNPGGNSSGTGNNGSNTDSSPQKVEAQGGKGGNQWDDGADHDGVTKIYVTLGGGIEQIRFDYVKNGQPKEGPFHGVRGNRSFIYTVEVNHPDEYLLSVKGCYDSSNIIQGIEFKTNIKTSEYFGYGDGSQFLLEVKDKKIIGFHGFADTHLNSLGAYFVPISTSSSSVTPPTPPSTPPPPTLNKSEAKGGNGGETFDDGVFDHVTKVYVGQGDSGVSYVKFDYEKGGKKETREHGIMSPLGVEEFNVDSGDYITSMEVYVDKITGYESDIITALAFKTFKGKISHPFGITTETKYELKDSKGGKLVGFHGKASDVLYAIGAYFAPNSTSSSSVAPLPPPTPPAPTLNKSEAQGGNGGETFDDGVFDHVTKVYVGQGDSGVSYVKFDYEKGGKKETREHGIMSPLGVEEFNVDSGDYITSMEVYVDKITGYKSDIITSLAFKTFKGKTSHPFGITTETKYELKDGKGGKLVGFHGKASDVLYAIGAYFAPTTN